MKLKLSLISIFIIFSFNLNAQNDFEINLYDTSIENPPLYDCGEIEKSGREVIQYTINNQRKTDVEIKNIKTPQGYMASTSTNVIEANKDATIYIIIERRFIEDIGDFSETVLIQTNLIQDIEINIKGIYLQ